MRILGAVYIAQGVEPHPLDQTDLGVGFRCILRGGIGILQEKEPRRRRGGSVGLALGPVGPTWRRVGSCRLVESV
jgi:hypothetical protein